MNTRNARPEVDALPENLVWLPDGHVSDWTLNALLDDELDLLPGEAASHVDTCDHCTGRLAELAPAVFALNEELSQLAEQEAKGAVSFPWALFLAVSTFMVTVALYSWRGQGSALGELPHELLTAARGLRLIGPFAAQRLGSELVLFGTSCLAIVVVWGATLAKRHSSRSESTS